MTVSVTIEDAAERLRTAERVLVIGCSGSGKSTLARKLADDCPEKIDRAFLAYVWNFEKTDSLEITENLAAFGPDVPVCVLKSRRENNRLLARAAAVH